MTTSSSNYETARITATSVCFLNKNGEILFQLRDDHAPTFKNHWTLPGGGLDEGEEENPKTGALREVEEELAFSLSEQDLKFVDVVQTIASDYNPEELAIIALYCMRLDLSPTEFQQMQETQSQREGVTVEWLSLEDINAQHSAVGYDFAKIMIEQYDALLEKSGGAEQFLSSDNPLSCALKTR